MDASEQDVGVDLLGRFIGGEVWGKGVAGEPGIGGDAFGDGDAQAVHTGSGCRQGFAATKAKWENNGLNDLLLSMQGRLKKRKLVALDIGSIEPRGEGGALQAGAKVASNIPD